MRVVLGSFTMQNALGILYRRVAGLGVNRDGS